MNSIEARHASLVSVANAQHCRSSLLTPTSVSMHTLPETASFANVDTLASAVKTTSYIATQGKDLVFSVRLTEAHSKPTDEEEKEEEEPPRPKKRRRDTSAEEADRVASARLRLAKSVPSLPSDELDIAQQVLTRLVLNLRGPNGEIVVQSYALLSKKLGADDSRARVVIAVRLNAGIELKVELLKACLGACWNDGLLTTLPTLQGIGKVELPLSEEAAAAAFFGNMSLLLVTSVRPKAS
mgnify:CR=1 FL=1